MPKFNDVNPDPEHHDDKGGTVWRPISQIDKNELLPFDSKDDLIDKQNGMIGEIRRLECEN